MSEKTILLSDLTRPSPSYPPTRLTSREAPLLKSILLLFLASCFLAAQSTAPERTVNGTVITSTRDPRIRIRVPESARYVGADRWPLYDLADCELHAFVEADSGKSQDKTVQRLYWIQFEGYLPSKPEMTYTYDSPQHATIGGLDFFVDTWVRPNDARVRPGSDREHVEALVRKGGYTMPSGMMYVRLVHLLDETKRRELMIVYGEDLAPTGFTAADLDEHGNAHDRWPGIAKGLVERAQQQLRIE